METISPVLLEISNDMVGVIGRDWIPRQLNAVWSRVLGWSTEELLKTSFKDLIHPDDYKRTQETATQSLSGDVIHNVINRYRCKNGSYRYLSWNYKYDVETNLVFVCARDITQQKVYDELSKQANRVAGLGTWSVDVFSQKVYWSSEMYELFDLDATTDEVSFERVLSFLQPDDKDVAVQKYSELEKLGIPFDLETRIITVKGRSFSARVMGSALREGEQIIRTFGIVQDISKSKEAERVLRYQKDLLNGLLDSSPAIVYVKDLRGYYILVSKQFEKLMGKSKDMLLGKNDFELFEERDALRHIRKDQQVLTSRQALNSEDDILMPDGSERHYLSEKFPLWDEEGRIIALAGVSTDITELYRYQKELLSAKEAAEVGTRAKSEFLANMSHEIRTPMNSIMGMAEILLETPLNDEQKMFVTILSRASENLLSIINDILDLSKIESGQMQVEFVPFSIQEVVRKSIELLQIKALEKKLELSYQIDPQTPDFLMGDSMRVQQVLINLIGNGLKFTEKGFVQVRVNVDPSERKWLHVEVEDTGIGISADQIQRVFGRFAQGDSSITRRFGGTGLGLSISKQLIERMGGHIGVESELGKGARFFFTIPLTSPAL